MKNIFSIFSVFFLLLSFAAAQEQPIRVAIFDGGHSFDQAAFDIMLKKITQGMNIERFHFPKDRSALGPELAKRFDVILFYDMDNTPLSQEQKDRIDALFQSGTGIFALHHHVCSNQKWSDYYIYLGGIAIFKTNNIINGLKYPLSTFIDEQKLDIHIVSDHPVTKGMKNFTLIDEAYGNCYVDPKATVLLTCDHSLSTHAVAWTWNYKKTLVLTCLLGHDAKAYNDQNFQIFLNNGIRYLAKHSRR